MFRQVGTPPPHLCFARGDEKHFLRELVSLDDHVTKRSKSVNHTVPCCYWVGRITFGSISLSSLWPSRAPIRLEDPPRDQKLLPRLLTHPPSPKKPETAPPPPPPLRKAPQLLKAPRLTSQPFFCLRVILSPRESAMPCVLERMRM